MERRENYSYLGCHPIGRANVSLTQLRSVRLLMKMSDAKVSQFDHTTVSQQQIVRLDVAMHHSVGVEILVNDKKEKRTSMTIKGDNQK